MSSTSSESDHFCKELYTITSRLSSVTRYSSESVAREESVMEHVGWIATWCTLVGPLIERQVGGLCIDYGAMIRRATIHDLDEYVTGDITRPTKYWSEEIHTSLHRLAESVVEQAGTSLYGGGTRESDNLLEIWQTAKDRRSVEGHIVKLGDLAAVVFKGIYEVSERSNKGFSNVVVNVKELLLDYDISPLAGGDTRHNREIIKALSRLILALIAMCDVALQGD